MIETQITGMTRVSRPRPNAGGSTVLAFFECTVGPIVLTGCAFVRTQKNGLVVWPPKVEANVINRQGVKFADDAFRSHLIFKAREAYRMLGGTDAEYAPRGAADDAKAEAMIDASASIHLQ